MSRSAAAAVTRRVSSENCKSGRTENQMEATQMIDVLRRFAWARIVVIIACSLASVATPLAQECKNRGQLDALYCDENNDLVADAPTDPKKLRDPSTLAFAHTPVA